VPEPSLFIKMARYVLMAFIKGWMRSSSRVSSRDGCSWYFWKMKQTLSRTFSKGNLLKAYTRIKRLGSQCLCWKYKLIFSMSFVRVVFS
jgi:hypothetical protein